MGIHSVDKNTSHDAVIASANALVNTTPELKGKETLYSALIASLSDVVSTVTFGEGQMFGAELASSTKRDTPIEIAKLTVFDSDGAAIAVVAAGVVKESAISHIPKVTGATYVSANCVTSADPAGNAIIENIAAIAADAGEQPFLTGNYFKAYKPLNAEVKQLIGVNFMAGKTQSVTAK